MSARSQAVRNAAGLFAFHRDQHHGWRRVTGWLMVVVVAESLAFAGYVHFHSTVYITVAATPDGRVIQMTPLEEPILSDAALRTWTVTAVTEAFTMGHHDWRRRLTDVREYFTDDGFDSFVKSLDDSLFLDRLRKNLQVASTVAQGAPVITASHIFDDRAGWSLEFPILITFLAGDRKVNQELLIKVLVVRVALEERVSGIGIQQIIARKA